MSIVLALLLTVVCFADDFTAGYQKEPDDDIEISEITETVSGFEDEPVYLLKCSGNITDLYLFFEATSSRNCLWDLSMMGDPVIDAQGEFTDPSELYDESDHSWHIFLNSFTSIPSDVRNAPFYSSKNSYYWLSVTNADFEFAFSVCIEVSSGESTTVDKTALNAALKTAKEIKDSYYFENDRWDGRTYNRSGFYSAVDTIIRDAQSTADSPVATQEAVNAATAKLDLTKKDSDLSEAVAKLIPNTLANTTLLYEEIQRSENLNKDNYTLASWSDFSKKLDAAQALQASMFDDDGNPTDANKAAAQKDVETKAAALKTAREALEERISKEHLLSAQFAQKAIEQLLDEQLTGKYTADSWSAYQAARTAAQKALDEIEIFATMGTSDLDRLQTATENLRTARYALVDEDKETISVYVSFSDVYAMLNDNVTSLGAAAGTVTLPAGATVTQAYQAAMGKLPSATSHGTFCANLFYINGQMYFPNHANINQNQYCGTFGSAKLRDGDRVTFVLAAPPTEPASSQAHDIILQTTDLLDDFRYTTIDAPEKVAAGETFEITVNVDGALPNNYTGTATGYANAKIFTSVDAYETAEAAMNAETTLDTYVTTDANGKATLTLYNEGFITLNAFCFDDAGRVTAGHTVIIEVSATDDLAGIRLQLREELDNAYYDEVYPKDVFSAEQWTQLQTAYNAGIAGIAEATTSGAARTAQMAALQTIKSLQSAADKANTDNLRFFRNMLATLPYPTDGKLDKAAEADVGRLKTRYGQMTEAQRADLTDEEQAKYKAISEATFTETAHQFELSFEQKFAAGVKDEDQATIEAMVKYLQEHAPNEDWYQQKPESGIGNQKLAELFTFNTTKSANSSTAYQKITESIALQSGIYACVNPDYIMYLLCRDNSGVFSGTTDTGAWSVSDANTTLYVTTKNNYSYVELRGKMVYTINGTQYAIRSIDVEGLTAGQYELTTRPFYEGSDYKGKTDTDCNLYVLDSFVSFTMPFNDVKVSVTWGPVSGTTSEVEKARDDALAALNAVFGKYDKTHENYNAIKAAYDKGVLDINAAQTVDAINAARREAAKAIEKAAAGSTGTDDAFRNGWGTPDNDKGFYAGNYVGTVKIIVENTTYSGAPEGFYTNPDDPDYDIEDSIVYRESYAIGDEDSMMTVILRALADDGYDWSGTGGSKFGITYLSSISNSKGKLGEFDGGKESGWMGTLNGFFVNLSFSEFTVQPNPNTSIQLADGDEIHVMYTCTGLGEDLGGTWYNSDTTLKALKVMDGDKALELAPEFESVVAKPGGTYSYTVMIDGDAAELTITTDAANKNYLVKRFLNEKVTDNTEGGSYYKSTQAIPVVSGDTIYIGCGEPVWPSMNNQSTEAREYVGTWYELHIVSASSGGTEVDAQIDALPNPDDLTYENRENYRQDIVQAKKAMDALKDSKVDEVRAKKLTDLCEKLAGFDAVDEVKAAIAKLPSVSNAALEDEESINAAKEKYDALDTELLKYLKASEKQKLILISF